MWMIPAMYKIRVQSTDDGKLHFSFVNSEGGEYLLSKSTGCVVITTQFHQYSKTGRLKYLGVS